jgi:hypothetical protein
MNVKNLNAKLNLCVILLCAFVTFGYLSLMSAMAAEKPSARNYRVIGADRKRIAIVNAKGEVEWEVENNAREVHDIAMLANGNVLYQTSYTTVVEMSPDKKIVWQYEAKPKAGYSGRVEIHSYQRLKNGLTMIAESGNARIVEVDKNANIVKEIALTVERPSAHRDTRMVRKLDNGNYLVCHEGDGKVREYDSKGKVIWTYAIDLAGRPRADGHGPEGHGTEVFGAIRMPNGNTMIAGGNNNRVFEVTPQGKIIWSVDHNELPGIAFAWMTTLQLLPNGNLIIGNTHAGPENPQLIEITRDKKVVWTFKNFTTFGNGLCATQVLGIRGKVIR